MSKTNPTHVARLKRKRRIRTRLAGTEGRPRLCVFRSAKHIYAQIIDDANGRTLAAVSSLDKAVQEHPAFESKVDQATFIGKLIAEKAKAQGVGKVVFDRNGFLYHGRVRAVSQGAREAGLNF